MRTFATSLLVGTALMVVGGTAMSAPSGKLSWFNDTPFPGAGSLGVPKLRPLNPAESTSFGISLSNAWQNPVAEGYSLDRSGLGGEANTVRLYGEVEAHRPRTSSFSATPDSTGGRVNMFGVTWQHRLNAMNTFAVTAEYGEGTAVYPMPLDTYDTRAAFSWTSVLPSDVKPSITGSVFFGDEMTREEMYRHLGRRYYGFTVGGSLTLFQSHTPYVSFKMQRSQFDTADETLLNFPRSGDRSLLSAGWKWQIQRDFSLQAEASYGLGEGYSSLDPYTLERSRILFGTRFGFK